MSQETKYYTPSIKEFHIRFEFKKLLKQLNID